MVTSAKQFYEEMAKSLEKVGGSGRFFRFVAGCQEFGENAAMKLSADDWPDFADQVVKKECHLNSQRIAMFNEDFKLWTGYVFYSDIPFPICHSWNVKDDQVYDFTIAKHLSHHDPVSWIGTPVPAAEFIHFVSTAYDPILYLFLKQSEPPPLKSLVKWPLSTIIGSEIYK